MKKKYKIYASWTVSRIYEVEAESLEDAMDEAESSSDCPAEDGEYIDGSFEVDREYTEELNGGPENED